MLAIVLVYRRAISRMCLWYSRARIYLFNRGAHPIQVLARDTGTFLSEQQQRSGGVTRDVNCFQRSM